MSEVTTGHVRQVLLLSTLSRNGGIGTWTNEILADHRTGSWEVVDTSRPGAVLGERLPERLLRYSLLDLKQRWRFVSQLRQRPRTVAWMAVAPGVGFLLRDLPIAAWASRARPTVVHLHGGRIEGFLGRGSLGRWLVRKAMANVEIVALSDEMARALATGGVGARVHVVGNPVPSIPDGNRGSAR